ncbi:MAG: hypothetical protein A2521_10530 [Deltaproteobacteria bacterium RIFOXYD12_FULL_57_12]|nr:MAG: hypothetical protein A2521_10530 [Deltaproteobacteria bacterium RIFOXYD12_FULL_57_12]
MNAGKVLQGNRGSLLNTVILVLVSLCVIGVILARLATTDVRIATNDKASNTALVHANAGTDEARARLYKDAAFSVPESSYSSTTWRAYIADSTDPDSVVLAAFPSFVSGTHLRVARAQNELVYLVEVRHKVDASNVVVRYGDISTPPDYEPEENTTKGKPVEVITSVATYGGAKRKVEIEARSLPIFFEVPGALYVGGTLQNNGTSQVVTGGATAGCPAVKDIVSTQSANLTCTGNSGTAGQDCSRGTGQNKVSYPKNDALGSDGCGGAEAWSACTSNPPQLQTNATPYRVADVVSEYATVTEKVTLVEGAGGKYQGFAGGKYTWGTQPDCQVTYFMGTDANQTLNTIATLDITGLSGCGVLVIDGDLIVGGNISWDGVIIVNGNITFSGGGNQQINGAVLASGNVLMSGTPDIIYDCKFIKNPPGSKFTRYSRSKWKDF